MSPHQGQGSPSAPDTPGERAVIAEHRRRRPARYRALYHREYSILLDALARFVQRIQAERACIALMATFGSVARLEPGTRGDTDLLVVFDLTDAPNPRELEDRYAAALVRTLNQVVYADGYRWPLWSPTLITGDSRASNLDPDFISNVGRDGVLLYRRDDIPMPPALAQLTPYAAWVQRIEALLAASTRPNSIAVPSTPD